MSLGARTALVIEDDRLSRDLVTDLLTDAGWLVRHAIAGDTGLAAALAEPPDAVLLDLGLPGLDGMSVMRALRADRRTSDVAIIAVSAQAMHGSADAAIAAGFDAYLVKPIDVLSFATEIERIVRVRAARRP